MLEEGGAITFLDGEPLAMPRGDLILTPGWAWHAHAKPAGPRIWLDGLDVPIVKLGAAF